MKVTFNINFHTVWGQKLCVVGSIPELGSWQVGLAKEMSYVGEGNWQLKLELPDDIKLIEYRYFLSVNDQQVFEEWERNHSILLDNQVCTYTLYDYWQVRPANMAFYSSAFTKSLFAHPSDKNKKAETGQKKLIIKIFAPKVEKTQSVAISGNHRVLGEWDPSKAPLLSCSTLPEWYIELVADDISYPLEYKFLVLDTETREPIYWESDKNRTLNFSSHEEDAETICISGLFFRENIPSWKTTGTVIPVFSLRSEKSFGVGDLGDLRLFIDWIKITGQRIIQVLPVNDTISSDTWADSYPYSAISIYALHPMYIDLEWMGQLKDKEKASFFQEKQKELNSKESVDYEAVIKYKLDYCHLFFEQEGQKVLDSKEYADFYRNNSHWLMPYAAYCYFRKKYESTDFSLWGEHKVYNQSYIEELCLKKSEAYPEISFIFFLQFTLHAQFKAVSDYARKNGIVLKGDLPIGVNRNSVEVWVEPYYFNMNNQAGAPPDDFSVIGQNWSFPTYNWETMEKDDFSWWRKRFSKLSDYFDCFRIDHILGFFRIWEIPTNYIQGLCGHFNPALPLSKEEIEHYGMKFDEIRFTSPHINEEFLPELFGELTNEVKGAYLAQSSQHHYILKSFCDTQSKINLLFEGKHDIASYKIKEGLFAIVNEVLFLQDPYMSDRFHPRISASQSYLYRELSNSDRYAFDHLYWDFFYHRHNNFWKIQALKKLTPLIDSTEMLVCGEDLGMIPESVPDVMSKLQILSLEIERMPKTAGYEFTNLAHLPYLSVCSTSTHDISPLRSWWKENKEKTQRYYMEVLMHEGDAPEECTSDIALQIIENHLCAPSMLTILPIQDWFSIDDHIKREDYKEERINVPANPKHYWRYRMHINIEDLINTESFNKKIALLIKKSGRK